MSPRGMNGHLSAELEADLHQGRPFHFVNRSTPRRRSFVRTANIVLIPLPKSTRGRAALVVLCVATLLTTRRGVGAAAKSNAPNPPPAITLTSPSNGAVFESPARITLRATASDPDGRIKSVKFYANNREIGGTDTKAPYEVRWRHIRPGQYSLVAVATDNHGKSSTSAAVMITVKPDLPPSVAITTPSNNALFAAPGEIPLTADAVANGDDPADTITQVVYRAGAQIIGSSTTPPYSVTWSSVPAGVYNLTAVATNSDGEKGISAPVNVTVDATPTVALAANGSTFTTADTVTLTAAAGDADGSVSNVDFYQDATKVGTSSGPSFSATWHPTTAGSYSFTAIATDNLGVASAPSNIVTITVNAATGTDPTTLPRIEDVSSLVYEGAFRLPVELDPLATFDYGGMALAFNAFNPGGPSLFLVGHDQGQLVTEISIPAINDTTFDQLATAVRLQPFTDPTEGGMFRVNPSSPNPVKVGGLLAYDHKLYISVYDYYDGANSQRVSHFVSGMNLAVTGDVNPPCPAPVDPANPDPCGFGVTYYATIPTDCLATGYASGDCLKAGFLDGYFGIVPPEWRSTLGGPVLNGNCCLGVIGRTSFGPAAFVMDPTQLGTTVPQPLRSNALVYYWTAHPLLETTPRPGLIPYFGGDDGCHNSSTLFNCTSQVRGVVFVPGTRSVLFFGRQGLGDFCYGAGTLDKSLNGQPVPGEPDVVYCYDPADPMGKGTHGWPYAHYVWAYDATDFLNVGFGPGQTLPWDVRPYAVWTLNLKFDGPFGTEQLDATNTFIGGDSENRQLGGATYDPATDRIYVSQMFGDGQAPVIYVFKPKR